MRKQNVPLGFRCPACKHYFIENHYDIIPVDSPHPLILAECPACGKRYRYLALEEDIRKEVSK